jgi:hypothetical protein
MERSRILLATGILLSTAFLATGRAEDGSGVDYDAMAEDIEIMRRVLRKALTEHHAPTDRDKAPEPEESLNKKLTTPGAVEDSALLFYTMATKESAQTRPNYRLEGFYVPGTGALYTLNLPVAVSVADGEDALSEHDLWTQTRAELNHRDGVRLWSTQRSQIEWEIDSTRYRETLRVLIETIGRYAGRMEQLASDEAVVVVARLQYSPPADAHVGDHLLLGSYFAASGQSTAQRVVVRVPVSAIRDFDADRLEVDELVRRCDIITYNNRGGGASGAGLWPGGSR